MDQVDLMISNMDQGDLMVSNMDQGDLMISNGLVLNKKINLISNKQFQLFLRGWMN
jgi:hypothetical protein